MARIKAYFWFGLTSDTQFLFDGVDDGLRKSDKLVKKHNLPSCLFYTGNKKMQQK
jgi:hypothetical protein